MDFESAFNALGWLVVVGLALVIPYQLIYGHEVFGYEDIGPKEVAEAKARYITALAELHSIRRQHGFGTSRMGARH